ncbi:unnamed protein product, partial [Ixodes pacificus]
MGCKETFSQRCLGGAFIVLTFRDWKYLGKECKKKRKCYFYVHICTQTKTKKALVHAASPRWRTTDARTNSILVWAFTSKALQFLFPIVPYVRSSADRKVCFYLF